MKRFSVVVNSFSYSERGNVPPQSEAISFLENSIYYFVKCAFIKLESGGCRLVVTHRERILVDQIYSTIKGAKIGFARRFGHKPWQKGIRPVWSSTDN